MEGAADATADLRGALSPLSVSASGTVNSSDLTLDQFKVDSLSLKWLIDGDRVKLTDVKAKLYQGEVSGSADVPTRAAAAGAVDLKLDDVDVQALAKSLPSMPLRLQGRASGSIRATIPAAGPDGQRQATGKIDLSAKALTVQNIPTDNLHADVDYKAGVAEYHLKGDSLGGHFTLDGKVPFTAAEKPATPGGGDGAPPDKDQPQAGGRFRFEGIQLSRLSKALGLGSALGQLHGRADIDLPFQVGPDNALTGTGTLAVRNLRLDGALLTDSLTANLVLKNQTVQVRNLNASVGQGNFRGVVVYNLREPDRSYFGLILEQVDASALLASYPDAAAQVQGTADLRLRGNLGRKWHGSGGVDLTRGRVFGAVVDELHLPVTFEFLPGRLSGRVTIRDANAQLAGGRATGQAEFDWSRGEAPRLDGEARFNNAEVRSLVKPGGSLGSYLVGRVTGRADIRRRRPAVAGRPGGDGERHAGRFAGAGDSGAERRGAVPGPRPVGDDVPEGRPARSAVARRLPAPAADPDQFDCADGRRRDRQHAGPARPGRDGQHRHARRQPELLAGGRPAHPSGRPHSGFADPGGDRPAFQSRRPSADHGHGAKPERAGRDGADPGRGGGALLRAAERGAGAVNGGAQADADRGRAAGRSCSTAPFRDGFSKGAM